MTRKLLISLCGLFIAVLTARLGSWFILVTGIFSLTNFAFSWLPILPIGGISFGIASTSGYLFPNRLFRLRLGWPMGLQMLCVSIGTYFLIYYLTYRSLSLSRTGAESFQEYLTSIWGHAALKFHEGEWRGAHFWVPESAPALPMGPFGFVLAVSDLWGFLVGALLVFRWSQPKTPPHPANPS